MLVLVRTGCVKRVDLGAIGSRITVEHQPSYRRSDLWIAYESERVTWLTSADFRLAFRSEVSANQVCFGRELLGHYRLVFEKRDSAGG